MYSLIVVGPLPDCLENSLLIILFVSLSTNASEDSLADESSSVVMIGFDSKLLLLMKSSISSVIGSSVDSVVVWAITVVAADGELAVIL